MSVCKNCGRQIEYGDCCSECAAAMQSIPAAAVPVQPAESKKIINGKIIALLSLLGVFGIMTIVVGIFFN